MKINYCNECKQQLKVTGTRHTETTTLRRKKCSNCGKRSVTIELRYAWYEQLLSAEQELSNLKDNVVADTTTPLPDDDALAYQEEVEREFQNKRSKLRWGK